jgi:hypothetical protein
MTRVSVIVSAWLLLTGGIGDAVLAGDRSRVGLLALQLALSVLTALAIWVELEKPPERRRPFPPRRHRRAYDRVAGGSR